MNNKTSLVQETKEHRVAASVIRNQIAVWLLGYVTIYGPLPQSELESSLQVDNAGDISKSIIQLEEAGFIKRRFDNQLEVSDSGARLGRLLGVGLEDSIDFSKKNIACDVFSIENADIAGSTKESKASLIELLVQSPRLYGEREGNRYGFVENKSIGQEVIYGYFAQEYWDRSIKYDKDLERREAWDARYTDLMFIWPLKSQIFILQDTRFYSAPALNMTTAKNRIILLMTIMLKHANVHRTGDILFRPFERTLSREEMLNTLEKSETVSRAQVGLESVTSPVERELAVFNPREDWNRALRDIINEYEVPNLGNVVFTAKKFGTLSKSKITKALALVGEIKNIKLGRGKNARMITPRVPTHVGKANVSDPIKEEEVLGILGVLQERLNVRLTDLPIKQQADVQIQLEI